MKRGATMWNNILINANIYEEQAKKRILLNQKYKHLSKRQINKKIRNSVNRKFKEQTKVCLGVHMAGVLRNLHNAAYESL